MYISTNVSYTTDLSIIVQIVTGIVGIRGLFYVLEDKHKILIDILRLEMIVQFVELLFYILFLRKIAISSSITTMASTRYFDWLITTPTMLFTISVYLVYQRYTEEAEKTGEKQKILTISDFYQENKDVINFILVCNLGMLVFGYMGEVGYMDKMTSLVIGTIFFLVAFYTIYIKFAIYSNSGRNLFYLMFLLWGLYGVAFIYDDVTKNNMYNILDLFAKNFFGVYLFYVIKKLRVIKNL